MCCGVLISLCPGPICWRGLRKKPERTAPCSKTYGRVFAPTLTREEYFATTIFCHRHKPQIVGLFEALLRREDITQEELAQIADLVARKNV